LNKIYSEVLKNFSEKSDHSKTTILYPLLAVFSAFASASVLFFYVKAPIWVPYVFAGLAAITGIIFLIVYLICFAKNPELLRSEKFTITKMAIEKSMIGDNNTGLIEMPREDTSNPKITQG
jgi:hypothetical protein